MDKKASKDGDSIPAQFFAQSARVLHVQDLPCHQEDDPKWEVPVGTQAEHFRVRLVLSFTLRTLVMLLTDPFFSGSGSQGSWFRREPRSTLPPPPPLPESPDVTAQLSQPPRTADPVSLHPLITLNKAD